MPHGITPFPDSICPCRHDKWYLSPLTSLSWADPQDFALRVRVAGHKKNNNKKGPHTVSLRSMVPVSIYASDHSETTAALTALAAVAIVTATSASYRRPCEVSHYDSKAFSIPLSTLCCTQYILLILHPKPEGVKSEVHHRYRPVPLQLLFTLTPPRGVFTCLLRDKPKAAVRKTAVLRLLCMSYWSQSEK